jgi:hypothetical protein
MSCGEPSQDLAQIQNLSLTFTSPLKLESGYGDFDIACDSVYGTGESEDWQMSNVQANSSLSLLQGKECRLSLKQYFDGTKIFQPQNSLTPLVINLLLMVM